MDPRVEPGDDGGWGEGEDGRESVVEPAVELVESRELGARGKGPLIPASPTFSARGRRARGTIAPDRPRRSPFQRGDGGGEGWNGREGGGVMGRE